MKKVINGMMYNTQTATRIASEMFSSPGDIYYVYEELYITPKGNYFLYGEGGPESKYCEQIGTNQYAGGAVIIPMSEEEAFEWCQDNGFAEVIEEYFIEYVEEA